MCLHTAAYGGAAAVAASGNQIFVTLQKGSHYPPTVVDVRVKYEQTVSDIRAAVAKKTGVPTDKQQLFWHQKELTPAYDIARNAPAYRLLGTRLRFGGSFCLACLVQLLQSILPS